MANITQRGEKFQLTVKNKLLQSPYYETFDRAEDAYAAGQRYEAILLSGRVPPEMDKSRPTSKALMAEAIRMYTQIAPITSSDNKLLNVVLTEVAGLKVSDISISWADGYVRDLKLKHNLAPGTIRKRIGVLARVLDWYLVREAEERGDRTPQINPLRLMPVGYSQYSKLDQSSQEGWKPREDVRRDHRIPPEVEERIRAVMAGARREDRQRALEIEPAFVMLFDLILDTGLRLSEAFKMRVNQVLLDKAVLTVEGSKGARGKIKPRVVPIKRALRDKLTTWCQGKSGLLFPFWDGTPEDAVKTTSRLSHRFGVVFDYAGYPELTEHDLRHEATCRWFELRLPGGGWTFSDVEICRIMGWTRTDMALRYASLRGEDLSSRLL